jgi:tetratricopeptide (TPR) repeat protein
VSYRLLAAPDGRLLRTAARTARSDDALVDAVGGALEDVLAALGDAPGRSERRPLPAATTHSLQALRRYAAGTAAFNDGRYDEAERHFADAVSLDSGFALAHSSLGQLYYFTNDRERGERAFRQALRNLGRLTPREQAVIRARAAGWRGDRTGSAAILRGWLSEQPRDYDVWTTLGYELMRAGRDSLALAAFSTAGAIGPLSATDLVNVAAAWNGRGRYDSALAAYHAAFALDPAVETQGNLNLEYGRALVQLGRLDDARRTFERKAALGGSHRIAALRSLAWLAAYQGDLATAEERLRESLPLSRALAGPLTVARNRIILAGLLSRRGLDAAARQQLDDAAALARERPLPPPVLYWIGRGLRELGDRDHSWLLDSAKARRGPTDPADAAALLGLEAEFAITAGEAARAVELAQQAAALSPLRLYRETLGFALVAAARFDEAVTALEAVGANAVFGLEDQLAWTEAGYWVGRVRELQHDTAAARMAYRAFLDRWGAATPPLQAAVDARRRLGNPRTADR